MDIIDIKLTEPLLIIKYVLPYDPRIFPFPVKCLTVFSGFKDGRLENKFVFLLSLFLKRSKRQSSTDSCLLLSF